MNLMSTYNRYPVSFVQGEGMKLYTQTGEVYWDYLSGLGVNNLGHSHPIVVSAIQEQAERLIHVSNLYQIREQERLAELLTKASGLGKAFFCNSGTEAVEALLKIARRYQQVIRGENRFEIVSAHRSFHGRTFGSLSATGQTKYQQGFEPLVPGFRHVPFNDLPALKGAVTSQTALVLLEVVQGEGGVYPADFEYLQQVAALCKREGVLLGLDEVQTGIGRCGAFYAYQRYGVKPDLVSSAKALAGGLPIGVLLASEEVAAGFEPGSHACTFGGNPLATYTATKVVEIVNQPDFLEQVEQAGAYLEEQLTSLAPGIIRQIRRLGLMIGIELSAGLSAPLLNKALFEKERILANAIGTSTLRILPPLICTCEDCDRFVQAFCRQGSQLAEGVVE